MHPQKSRRFFVVIVHYGDATVLQAAVAALRTGSRQPDYIVIVDHNPEPLAAALFVDAHTACARPSSNDGYGAGCNFGIGVLWQQRPTAHDIVACMNNDVVVNTDTLTQLTTWWRDNPAPALVGVVVEEGSRHVVGGGTVNMLTGRAYLTTKNESPNMKSKSSYIHGAFFSAPWEVLMKTKGLPEHYFMYWEDIAFSWRVRQAGFLLKIAATVHVHHSEHSPSQADNHKLYYLVRNGALFLSQETAWPYRWWWYGYNRARLRYHAWRGQQPVVQAALQDALKGRSGKKTDAHGE